MQAMIFCFMLVAHHSSKLSNYKQPTAALLRILLLHSHQQRNSCPVMQPRSF